MVVLLPVQATSAVHLLLEKSRPYDLHSAQIKKSDDLDNARAKSRMLEALLAQAVAMQIISTPRQ
jgi:hypothetical protein